MSAAISERLRGELHEREWTTRYFQQKVWQIAPGVRGTGYSSVYEYVSGKTDPPLSFLLVAAKALNVSPAWLAFGDDTNEPAKRQPCPFCGSDELELHDDDPPGGLPFMGCDQCNALGPEGDTAAEAEQRWNRRVFR